MEEIEKACYDKGSMYAEDMNNIRKILTNVLVNNQPK
jgi:hypothetical protein